MERVSKRFISAYEKVEQLQGIDRYLGAFIFGSVARGDFSGVSDFDVKVVIDEDNPCKNINHPIINGVKLDITFQSLGQLRSNTEQEMAKGERIPMLAESIIIFDKTGGLTDLQKRAQEAKPRRATQKDYQLIQFMVYHANDKARRSLNGDPASALLSMGINVNDLLKIHYNIQAKWWVSNKRLLGDLEQWDSSLAVLLRNFATEPEVKAKFDLWSQIIDHILEPIGGRQPIAENNCTCEVCKADLKHLT